jgi:Zn-dependent M28 family amino/carboxypeptidase
LKLHTPVALALAVGASAALAPSAHAQSPSALRMTVSGVPETIQAGDAFTLRTTVTNSGSKTAHAPRYFVGLTRGTKATSTFKRLATRNLPPYRAKRKQTTTLRVRIRPDSSGTYRLVICGTQNGRRARCLLLSRINVTKRPVTPATPNAPGTPATPATPASPALPLDKQLTNAISASELLEHTNAFADIAERPGNNGNRAASTQGYDDSVAYVVNRLARAGYEPRIDRFEFVVFAEQEKPVLTVSTPGPAVVDADYTSMSYSGAGDTGTTPVTPVDLGPTPTPDDAPPSTSNSGCEAADFVGFPAGTIALIKRGTCDFAAKAQNAATAGAAGVIIFNEGQPGREDLLNGTLGGPLKGADIPVIGTTAALGEQLATAGNPTARIVSRSTNTPGSSMNVLADTPTGDASKTVVIGSHLDSVGEGAGINDNGSGSAFNLELAEQMSKLGIKPANRVRFAFWGAEEAGLIGSTDYITNTTQEEFDQLGLNLNFDMLASPNHARFIYDGDFSDSPKPAGAFLAPGSADVEQAFKAAFDAQGLGTLPTGFDGRSDYKAFQDNGIPAGGLFSGAEDIKTAEEAALFGGTAGLAFDPNYHGAGDDRDNLDVKGFEEMADAAAQVSLKYATAPELPAKYSAASAARSDRNATSRRAAGGARVGDRFKR